LAITEADCGILYGWELAEATPAPAGNDSPDDDLTTPQFRYGDDVIPFDAAACFFIKNDWNE
jgi:hypothetical protein